MMNKKANIVNNETAGVQMKVVKGKVREGDILLLVLESQGASIQDMLL